MAEDLGTLYWKVGVDTSALDRAEASMDALGNKAKAAGKDADKLGKDVESAGKRGAKGADELATSMGGASNAMRIATMAAAALGVTLGAREIIAYSDAWQSAANQLRLVTSSTMELEKAQTALMAVANDTRSSFESTANLYSRLSRATSEMGLSQSELLGITTTINQSFAVSGATAAEAAAAITQLSQGLAAGALRGDEFNSVAEQAPGIMRAIASSLNMTTGELRAFAAEGGITADIVVKALQQSADSIDQDFGKSVATFGQSMQIAKNNMMEFVGGSDAVTGAVSAAGGAVIALTKNLDALAEVLGAVVVLSAARLAPAIGVQVVGALTAATAAMTASTVATTTYNAALMVTERTIIATTAAQRLMNGALALAGGPAGLAVLATYGIYRLADAYSEHEEAIGKTIMSNEDMIEAIGLVVDENGNLVDSVDAASRAAQKYQERIGIAVGQMNAAGIAAEILDGKVGGLAGTMVRYGENVKFTIDAHDAHVEALENYRKEQDDAREATDKAQRSILETISALENEQLALGMTSRAAAVFEAVTRATAEGALPEQIARIAELTAMNYDLAESTKTGQEATKDWSKEQEQATEAAQRQWEQTRDSLKDLILDYENLGETGKRIIKELAAEWAASGLMKLMGMGSPLSSMGSVSSLMGGGGGAGMGAVSSIAGALLKGVPGSASFVGPVAAGGGAGIGGTIMGAIGAIPGWGWAAMGAAALGAILNNDDGKVRSNAGMLVGPTPGAKSEYMFGVDPFASGLNVTGIARREDQSAAQQVISQFRDVDAIVASTVRALGGRIDLSGATLAGLNEDAAPGSAGTFLGRGIGGADLAGQLNSFVGQLANHIEGLDAALMESVKSASSAEEAINLLTVAADKLAANNAAIALHRDLLQKFGTDEQKLASAMEEITAEFDKFGAKVPETIGEFHEMVRAIDPLTDSGKKAIEALKGLSGAISIVEKLAGGSASESEKAKASASSVSSFSLFSGGLASSLLQGTTEEDRAGELARRAALANVQGSADYMRAEQAAGEAARRQAMMNVANSALQMGIAHHDPMANGGAGINGSHRTGLDRVPFDGYIAQLHEGERVQTAADAARDDATKSMVEGMKMQMAKHMALMYSIVQRWDQDGLPPERTA